MSNAAKFLSPTPIDFTSPDDAAGGGDTSPGDYYYRVLRGINGSAMENFGTRLRVDDIWKVVMFLKTIPNGGLDPDKLPTPDMYIQWKAPPDFSEYLLKHPVKESQNFIGPPVKSLTPFEQEFLRVLPGMNIHDRFVLPGYGPVSVADGARDIEAIYNKLLEQEYADFAARGGEPAATPEQKAALPEYVEEAR